MKKASGTGGVTDYVNGIQYKAGGVIDVIQTEEGLARNNNGIYSYEYTLTDHLGNNRAILYRNPNTSQLEVLQRYDYYAFGLCKATIVSSNENKYLYNKKELQEELGQYDYGARFYDPVIGRWNVIDPLAELDRKTTPYAAQSGFFRILNCLGFRGEVHGKSYALNVQSIIKINSQ